MQITADLSEVSKTAQHDLTFTHLFLTKNIVYKNIQAQIGQKLKNILRISSASALAIVFCFFVFLKYFLD